MFYKNTIRAKKNMWGTIRLFIGHALAYFYEPSIKARSLRAVHTAFKSTYPDDMLSEIELQRLEEYQIDTMQFKQRMAFFEMHNANNTIEKTFYGSVIPLIRKIITEESNIKQVLNIGCSFDFADYVLANEFKEIDFLGIDFPKNIEEFNKSFLRENFKVINGYALDFLKKNNHSYDIIYFSSTANNIKNNELHHYCKVIAEKARYIVFNEPLWIPLNKTPDLTRIDPHDSIPGHVYKDVLHDKFGYLSYNHNYKKIIEEHGFETIHYHTFRGDSAIQGTKIGRVQLIGKRI